MWDYIRAFLFVNVCTGPLAFCIWIGLGRKKLAALFGATVSTGIACLWLAFGQLSGVSTTVVAFLCIIVAIIIARFVNPYCTYDN